MNIQKTIRSLRKEKGLNQQDLAARSGITQTYLSQIETSLKNPSLKVLKSVSGGLGIPLPILMFLSMDDGDIPKNKRYPYKRYIKPSVDALIKDFFLSD